MHLRDEPQARYSSFIMFLICKNLTSSVQLLMLMTKWVSVATFICCCFHQHSPSTSPACPKFEIKLVSGFPRVTLRLLSSACKGLRSTFLFFSTLVQEVEKKGAKSE
jgi:hypothetical protein